MSPFRQARVTRVVTRARTLVGTARYVYGGVGEHQDDCSGLTEFCWWAGGVHLPHNAAQQLAWCQPLSLQEVGPGDLAFYYDAVKPSHVGLVVSVRTDDSAHELVTTTQRFTVQATDPQHGIEEIPMNLYTPALAWGRPHRKPWVAS